jgi:hypothetical protein
MKKAVMPTATDVHVGDEACVRLATLYATVFDNPQLLDGLLLAATNAMRDTGSIVIGDVRFKSFAADV